MSPAFPAPTSPRACAPFWSPHTYIAHDHVLHTLLVHAQAHSLQDGRAAQIGGEDDDGVLEAERRQGGGGVSVREGEISHSLAAAIGPNSSSPLDLPPPRPPHLMVRPWESVTRPSSKICMGNTTM